MTTGLFHINPDNGDVGACAAKNGKCPFGNDDEHYTSSESAREAYEMKSEIAKEKSLKAWKRKTFPSLENKTTPKVTSHQPIYTSGHGHPAPASGHGF